MRRVLAIILLALAFGQGLLSEGRAMNAGEFFSDPDVAALATAARDGMEARVRQFAASGVDVNAVGKRGFTPLIFAQVGQAPAARGAAVLLELGADPNARTEPVVRLGQPVVYFAAIREQPDILKLLLDKGVDPNTPDDTGLPVALAAIQARRYGNFHTLVEAGADLAWTDGFTTLAEALAAQERFEDLAWILRRGARVRKTAADTDLPGLVCMGKPRPGSPQEPAFQEVKALLARVGLPARC